MLTAIKAGRVDVVVVYKVDRLSRSLADFARLMQVFDEHRVSFVSVTQQFNTTTSMGRLMLNVLLSFAQFEREVTGERIRDKIAASKAKGMWMGGNVPLGYRVEKRKLVVDENDVPVDSVDFEAVFKDAPDPTVTKAAYETAATDIDTLRKAIRAELGDTKTVAKGVRIESDDRRPHA